MKKFIDRICMDLTTKKFLKFFLLLFGVIMIAGIVTIILKQLLITGIILFVYTLLCVILGFLRRKGNSINMRTEKEKIVEVVNNFKTAEQFDNKKAECQVLVDTCYEKEMSVKQIKNYEKDMLALIEYIDERKKDFLQGGKRNTEF